VAIVRYELCYAHSSHYYEYDEHSPHEATWMTPRRAYACCCTAVRGAASRVAAPLTITHSQQ